MPRHVGVFGLVSLLLAIYPPLNAGADPLEDFNEAIRLDSKGKSELAFSFYLRAANAGLPQAQFNVAVMLDSGRGVSRNVTQAGLWYARAAAHGNQRAAYNMGQLYESGEGVPQNSQMARAWFAASGLAASSAHLAGRPKDIPADTVTFTPPALVAPAAGSTIVPESGGVVLVWTSGPQPTPVRYYVELRVVEPSGSHEVFSGAVRTSSVFAALPAESGNYAWRVLVVSNKGEAYLPSGWASFNVLPRK